MQVNHAPSYEGTVKTSKVTPLKDSILVKDMNFDERITAGGIILRSDDGKSEGVRPRWAEVYAVGPEQTDVKVGDWVLMDHGRWSEGLKFRISEDEEIKIWLGDPNGILGVSTTGKPAELQDV